MNKKSYEGYTKPNWEELFKCVKQKINLTYQAKQEEYDRVSVPPIDGVRSDRCPVRVRITVEELAPEPAGASKDTAPDTPQPSDDIATDVDGGGNVVNKQDEELADIAEGDVAGGRTLSAEERLKQLKEEDDNGKTPTRSTKG